MTVTVRIFHDLYRDGLHIEAELAEAVMGEIRRLQRDNAALRGEAKISRRDWMIARSRKIRAARPQ